MIVGLVLIGLVMLVSAARNKSKHSLLVGIVCLVVGGFLYIAITIPIQQKNEDAAQDARIQQILDEEYYNNNTFSK